VGKEGSVDKIDFVRDTDLMINGGYFVFRKDIFEYINEGEELVAEPFHRLMKKNQLLGYRYDKFWYCMDTFKEQQELTDLYNSGQAPWEVWKHDGVPESSMTPAAGPAEATIGGVVGRRVER